MYQLFIFNIVIDRDTLMDPFASLIGDHAAQDYIKDDKYHRLTICKFGKINPGNYICQ